LKGDNVGDENVTQHFKGSLTNFTKTTLTKGYCSSVGWDMTVSYNVDDYYGVKATAWKTDY